MVFEDAVSLLHELANKLMCTHMKIEFTATHNGKTKCVVRCHEVTLGEDIGCSKSVAKTRACQKFFTANGQAGEAASFSDITGCFDRLQVICTCRTNELLVHSTDYQSNQSKSAKAENTWNPKRLRR